MFRQFAYAIPAALIKKFYENNFKRLKDLKVNFKLEHVWLDESKFRSVHGSNTFTMELYTNDITRIKKAIGKDTLNH